MQVLVSHRRARVYFGYGQFTQQLVEPAFYIQYVGRCSTQKMHRLTAGAVLTHIPFTFDRVQTISTETRRGIEPGWIDAAGQFTSSCLPPAPSRPEMAYQYHLRGTGAFIEV
jgi:hypothetical protein